MAIAVTYFFANLSHLFSSHKDVEEQEVKIPDNAKIYMLTLKNHDGKAIVKDDY